MASYKDWLLIENPNELTEKQLRQAVSTMGSVANKRLKRMEQRDIFFGSGTGDETLSGVRKFSVRGKSLDEVKREFKRVRNFLSNKQSSLTGMKEVYKDFRKEIAKGRKRIQGKKLTKREKQEVSKMQKQKETSGIQTDRTLSIWDELKQWRKVWDYYNRLVDEGEYAPSAYDSNQIRDYILSAVKRAEDENLSDNEVYENILSQVKADYEYRKENELDTEDGIDTSSFFDFGVSD